jgi:hypothetical protein
MYAVLRGSFLFMNFVLVYSAQTSLFVWSYILPIKLTLKAPTHGFTYARVCERVPVRINAVVCLMVCLVCTNAISTDAILTPVGQRTQLQLI